MDVRSAYALTLFLATVCTCTAAFAQNCPAKSNNVCRETAPNGNLLHLSQTKNPAVKYWVTQCKPWTSQSGLDETCNTISKCEKAGGFGKFLKTVTFQCKTKHFDGYFGLDGMTVGILDWTQDNLPSLLKAYQQRNKARFDELFGKLDIPMKDGCADANWVCNANKQGFLNCDKGFRGAMEASLKDPDFRKAQIDMALRAYEARLTSYKNLGLTTEYGNTAIAVVANNLKAGAACRPATWKSVCIAKANEKELVDCMLDQYVKNGCRGNVKNSKERADTIREVFKDATPSTDIHPTADAIASCLQADNG